MLIKEVLQKSTDFLRAKKIDSPRLDAELIIAHFLKLKRIDLYLKFEQPLTDNEIQTCREAIARRGKGEPVAYILGQKDFYGRTFYVDKNVLIPRPETEILVEEVLNYTKSVGQQNTEETAVESADENVKEVISVLNKEPLKVLDFGGGSGIIGITLGLEIQNSKITIVEISDSAVKVEERNLDLLASDKKNQFQIIRNDVEKFSSNEKFDIIVANPPYIDPETSLISDEVKKYEPHLALFAEEKGFSAISKWLEKALSLLKKQGFIIFEIGFDQGLQAKDLFEAKKCFSDIKIVKDLAGHDRFIKAVFNG